MLLAAIPTSPLPTPETASGERRLAGMSGKTIGFQLARFDLFHPLFLKSPLREARAV